MSRKPLKVHAINPPMGNGDRNPRNATQSRRPGETMEQFAVRRARGICANIQSFMREERETIATCAKDGGLHSLQLRGGSVLTVQIGLWRLTATSSTEGMLSLSARGPTDCGMLSTWLRQARKP